MNFKKKPYFQKDISNQNAVPSIHTEEQLSIQLRKNFLLPSYIQKPQQIQKYSQRLLYVSLLKFHLLDRFFFQPLCESLNMKNIKVRKLLSSKEMQSFIQIILCKLKLFNQLVLQEIKKLIDEKIKRTEPFIVVNCDSYLKNVRFKKYQLLFMIKQKFFTNSIKLVAIFQSKNNKKQQLRISKSHPNYKGTHEDYDLSLFLRDQLIKQRQNIVKQKIEKFNSIQKYKNTLKPLNSYHEFTQKILYYYSYTEQMMNEYLNFFIPQTSKRYQKLQESIEEKKQQIEILRQTKSQNLSVLSDKLSSNKSTTISEQISNKTKMTKIQLKYYRIPKEIKDRRQQVRQNFIKNVAIQLPILAKCLNCIQYFYAGFPVNLQRNHLIKYEIINSINMIKDYPDIIRQMIGGMVNDGGGTILFGCKKNNFGFIPIGQLVRLKEQQSFKASFQNLLKCIVPQSFQKLIDFKIDFIPLKQSPFDSDGQMITHNFSHKIQRSFIPQLYVMRVKINPKSQKQLFCCQIDKKNYFFTRFEHRSLTLKDEALYEEMKRKIYKFTALRNIENLNRIENQLGKRFVQKIIRGKRQLIQNNHEGKCFETLTLSVVSAK